MKIIFQWSDGKIVFERSYQQLDGDLDYWTDKAIEEVLRFGKNVKIVLINEPLKIEFCPNDKVSLSRTLDKPAARRVIANDWKEKSVATVYTNPEQASLAIVIFYNNEETMCMSIHRCGNKIRYTDYKGVKSAKVNTACSDIILKVGGTEYVHGGIAFYGGGYNYSYLDLTRANDETKQFGVYDVNISVLENSKNENIRNQGKMLPSAAGAGDFRFYLYNNKSSRNLSWQENIKNQGNQGMNIIPVVAEDVK